MITSSILATNILELDEFSHVASRRHLDVIVRQEFLCKYLDVFDSTATVNFSIRMGDEQFYDSLNPKIVELRMKDPEKLGPSIGSRVEIFQYGREAHNYLTLKTMSDKMTLGGLYVSYMDSWTSTRDPSLRNDNDSYWQKGKLKLDLSDTKIINFKESIIVDLAYAVNTFTDSESNTEKYPSALWNNLYYKDASDQVTIDLGVENEIYVGGDFLFAQLVTQFNEPEEGKDRTKVYFNYSNYGHRIGFQTEYEDYIRGNNRQSSFMNWNKPNVKFSADLVVEGTTLDITSKYFGIKDPFKNTRQNIDPRLFNNPALTDLDGAALWFNDIKLINSELTSNYIVKLDQSGSLQNTYFTTDIVCGKMELWSSKIVENFRNTILCEGFKAINCDLNFDNNIFGSDEWKLGFVIPFGAIDLPENDSSVPIWGETEYTYQEMGGRYWYQNAWKIIHDGYTKLYKTYPSEYIFLDRPIAIISKDKFLRIYIFTLYDKKDFGTLQTNEIPFGKTQLDTKEVNIVLKNVENNRTPAVQNTILRNTNVSYIISGANGRWPLKGEPLFDDNYGVYDLNSHLVNSDGWKQLMELRWFEFEKPNELEATDMFNMSREGYPLSLWGTEKERIIRGSYVDYIYDEPIIDIDSEKAYIVDERQRPYGIDFDIVFPRNHIEQLKVIAQLHSNLKIEHVTPTYLYTNSRPKPLSVRLEGVKNVLKGVITMASDTPGFPLITQENIRGSRYWKYNYLEDLYLEYSFEPWPEDLTNFKLERLKLKDAVAYHVENNLGDVKFWNRAIIPFEIPIPNNKRDIDTDIASVYARLTTDIRYQAPSAKVFAVSHDFIWKLIPDINTEAFRGSRFVKMRDFDFENTASFVFDKETLIPIQKEEGIIFDLWDDEPDREYDYNYEMTYQEYSDLMNKKYSGREWSAEIAKTHSLNKKWKIWFDAMVAELGPVQGPIWANKPENQKYNRIDLHEKPVEDLQNNVCILLRTDNMIEVQEIMDTMYFNLGDLRNTFHAPSRHGNKKIFTDGFKAGIIPDYFYTKADIKVYDEVARRRVKKTIYKMDPKDETKFLCIDGRRVTEDIYEYSYVKTNFQIVVIKMKMVYSGFNTVEFDMWNRHYTFSDTSVSQNLYSVRGDRINLTRWLPEHYAGKDLTPDVPDNILPDTQLVKEWMQKNEKHGNRIWAYTKIFEDILNTAWTSVYYKKPETLLEKIRTLSDFTDFWQIPPEFFDNFAATFLSPDIRLSKSMFTNLLGDMSNVKSLRDMNAEHSYVRQFFENFNWAVQDKMSVANMATLFMSLGINSFIYSKYTGRYDSHDETDWVNVNEDDQSRKPAGKYPTPHFNIDLLVEPEQNGINLTFLNALVDYLKPIHSVFEGFAMNMFAYLDQWQLILTGHTNQLIGNQSKKPEMVQVIEPTDRILSPTTKQSDRFAKSLEEQVKLFYFMEPSPVEIGTDFLPTGVATWWPKNLSGAKVHIPVGEKFEKPVFVGETGDLYWLMLRSSSIFVSSLSQFTISWSSYGLSLNTGVLHWQGSDGSSGNIPLTEAEGTTSPFIMGLGTDGSPLRWMEFTISGIDVESNIMVPRVLRVNANIPQKPYITLTTNNTDLYLNEKGIVSWSSRNNTALQWKAQIFDGTTWNTSVFDAETKTWTVDTEDNWIAADSTMVNYGSFEFTMPSNDIRFMFEISNALYTVPESIGITFKEFENPSIEFLEIEPSVATTDDLIKIKIRYKNCNIVDLMTIDPDGEDTNSLMVLTNVLNVEQLSSGITTIEIKMLDVSAWEDAMLPLFLIATNNLPNTSEARVDDYIQWVKAPIQTIAQDPTVTSENVDYNRFSEFDEYNNRAPFGILPADENGEATSIPIGVSVVSNNKVPSVITYQWQESTTPDDELSWTDIEGETETSYLAYSGSGWQTPNRYYRVKITDTITDYADYEIPVEFSSATIYSRTFTISMQLRTSIMVGTQELPNITAYTSDTATLSIDEQISSIPGTTIQWEIILFNEWTDIVGETNRVLNVVPYVWFDEEASAWKERLFPPDVYHIRAIITNTIEGNDVVGGSHSSVSETTVSVVTILPISAKYPTAVTLTPNEENNTTIVKAIQNGTEENYTIDLTQTEPLMIDINVAFNLDEMLPDQNDTGTRTLTFEVMQTVNKGDLEGTVIDIEEDHLSEKLPERLNLLTENGDNLISENGDNLVSERKY